MSTANKDIRLKAKESNVLLWRVAYKLGITDSYFSRKLRRELPQEEKEKIFRIIDELKGEQ